MNVGFIGTGEIAEALIEGITGQGHKIYVSNRSNLRSKRLSKEYTEVIACDNDEVCSSSDIIFICLMAIRQINIISELEHTSSLSQAITSVYSLESLFDLKLLRFET